MQSTADKIFEGAELGKLPFDIFALERWDYSRPVEQDQEQWDHLAREWLDLDARGRHPYHPLTPESREAPATAEQMSRVLVPRQTMKERNLSVVTEMGHGSPVWLRTCYSPELASVYTEWCDSMELDSLDDVGEYYDPPGEGEEFKMPLYEAKLKEKTMMFLIDEEALRDNLIKVLWLDIHGACVWDNRLPPDDMLAFKGRMFDGGSLADLSEEFEDDEEMYERGAVLNIN
ncbi:hypothetical protein F5B22DRAFT_646603 [Xylaria bambusicola]|uniref:uncharacterized protein n=1 Tax=Xylaria bambusicola TaxID=326684 RepID=UPI002007BAAA|nr:uncharacterized protein F5B22DRAFT_646603 [Xylaria bambusicola]KAI0516869.1 hypothetical protein F5B22DRAFT_646603 [Xylaria bambusicola]